MRRARSLALLLRSLLALGLLAVGLLAVGLLAVGLLAVAGCDDTDARRRARQGPEIRMAWVVQHPRWGREALFLERLPHREEDEGGRLRYVLDPPEQGGARVRAALDLSAEEVRELRDRLEALDACALRSSREALDANESRPRLSLRFEGLRCEPELYFGEWREGEAAEVHALVETLKARVRAQGN